jgi:TonB family protein
MNARMIWIGAVILCLSFFGPGAQSKESLWQVRQAEGVQAQKEARYADAERYFTEALAAAEQARAGEGELAARRFELGYSQFQQGKYSEAEANWRSALAVFQRVSGPKDTTVANTLNALGSLYDVQGKYAQAVDLLRQALVAFEKAAPDQQLRRAGYQSTLASALLHLGLSGEAQTMAEQSVSLARQYGSGDDFELRRSLCTLGTIYESRGEFAKATPLFEESLKIAEKTNGPNSVEAGTLLANLAMNYSKVGRTADAEGYMKRQVEIFSRAYGAESIPLAATYEILGSLDKILGRYSDAEARYQQAISIYERKLGRANPRTAKAIENLGSIYLEQGRLKQAVPLFTEAITTYEQSIAPTCPNLIYSLVSLARIGYFEGNFEIAQRYYQRAIDIAQQKWSATNPGWSQLRSGLALVNQRKATPSDPNAGWTNTLTAVKTLNNAGSYQNPIGDKWALVVGVSRYGKIEANNFAQNGADSFYKYLTDYAGFKRDHVLLLLYEQATRENIMAAMGDHFLPRSAKPNDLVVIYMATHGSPSDQDISGLSYLTAYDTVIGIPYATAIPLQYVSRTVSERIPAKRTIIVIESCHSGAAAGPRAAGVDAAELAQSSGQIVITSSRPDQQSLAWQNIAPVFTYRFLQGLTKSGPNTTLAEAFKYASDLVSQDTAVYGKKQNPMMVCGWPGEQLALAKSDQSNWTSQTAKVFDTQLAPAAPAPLPAPQQEKPAVVSPAVMAQLRNYVSLVEGKIKRNWYPPEGLKSTKTVVLFQINRTGKLQALRVTNSCGKKAGDDAAMAAVNKTAPFAPLPAGSPPSVDISFAFDYNVTPKKRTVGSQK